MVKAVIFDMDGVIIDSEPIHCEADRMTMEYFGLEITDEELNKYVGVSSSVMWTELRPIYKLSCSVEELIKKTSNYKNYLFGNKKFQLIPGIFELLNELKSVHIKIGLASSSPREFIEMILTNLQIIKFFDIIVSGEEVPKGKPSPDIFLRTAELLSLAPSNCFVIEDSEHGVKAANLAGMKCIGFINPNSGNQDLTLSNKVVYSIKEINYKKY